MLTLCPGKKNGARTAEAASTRASTRGVDSWSVDSWSRSGSSAALDAQHRISPRGASDGRRRGDARSRWLTIEQPRIEQVGSGDRRGRVSVRYEPAQASSHAPARRCGPPASGARGNSARAAATMCSISAGRRREKLEKHNFAVVVFRIYYLGSFYLSPQRVLIRRFSSADPDQGSLSLSMSTVEGVYDFQHPSGSFEVQLRTHGRFHAPKFVTKSSWSVEGKRLYLDFGKFGNYEFTAADGGAWHGSAVGDAANWRKLVPSRSFTPLEAGLLDRYASHKSKAHGSHKSRTSLAQVSRKSRTRLAHVSHTFRASLAQASHKPRTSLAQVSQGSLCLPHPQAWHHALLLADHIRHRPICRLLLPPSTASGRLSIWEGPPSPSSSTATPSTILCARTFPLIPTGSSLGTCSTSAGVSTATTSSLWRMMGRAWLDPLLGSPPTGGRRRGSRRSRA